MNTPVSQTEHNNNTESRKQKLNLARFHGDAAVSAVEDAAIGYQSPSIIAAGANAQTVSILATIVNLCLALVCLKAPKLIEKLGLTKMGAMKLAFTNMLTWIPLMIAFFLSYLGVTPMWIAMLWLINIMPAMLVSFQKDNWLSNIVPDRSLGKYLGQRLAIKSGFYLAAFFALGYMMDRLGQDKLSNFGLVFLLAVVVTFADFMIFSFMHDPRKDAPPVIAAAPKIKFGLKDYLGDLVQKKLDKFVIFTGLINVSIGLSAPFYAVYMLQEKNFSYMSYTVIISVEFLARIISGPFWGKFADKKGNIQVLKIVSRIVPVLPLCWLFSTNLGYLAVIQLMSGICWGAFDLSTQSYLYKVAPQSTKLHYIVYTRSIMLFSVAMGGLAGSFLIKGIFEVFGSKLLTIIMISGLFRGFIVLFIMPKLIDLAVKYGIPGRAKISLSLTKKETAKHGLFYHAPKEEVVEMPSNVIDGSATMHKRSPILEQKLMEAQAAKNQLNLLTSAVENGRKRNWALEALAKKQAALTAEANAAAKNTMENEDGLDLSQVVRRNWIVNPSTVKETVPPVQAGPSRRPWYGDSEIFASHQTAKVPVTATPGNVKTLEVSATRTGLFHDGVGWARYREQSLQSVIKEKQEYKTVKKPKR